MIAEIPSSSPEKEKTKDDARKFIVSGAIDLEFLAERQAKPHDMTVDWTVVGAGSETKIVRKVFDDGTVDILRITKVKKADGSRDTEKEALSLEEYSEATAYHMKHLEKRRYEFDYMQNGVRFSLKYDDIEDGRLHLLEVDAETSALRDRFNPSAFEYSLTEVSGKPEYEGHSIVDLLETRE